MRLLILSSALLLCACPPEAPPEFGGFTLDSTESSFSIKAGDLEALASSTAMPVATRRALAHYEMSFGSWVITDNPPTWSQGVEFKWDEVSGTTATGTWRDENGAQVLTLIASDEGEGILKLRYVAANAEANRISLKFRCDESDRFAGFGGQADQVDHHGHTVAIWTSEPGIGKNMEDDETPYLWQLIGTRHASSFGLPTWVSNRGYLGLVHSDARTVFEVCSKDSATFRIEVWDREATLLLYRGAPKDALRRATGHVLTRPVRPAPLAFAPWNDAIMGPDEVLRVANLLRDEDIPSSVIWTEDFRGGADEGTGYRLKEEWDTDTTLYPDAPGLAATLAEAGFSWHAYFNTFLVKDTRVTAAALEGGHAVRSEDGGVYWFDGVTFKPSALADLSRPETREWVKTYLRAALDDGFTGWMADFGEWLPHDAVLYNGEDPKLAHNRYALDWARLNKEVLDEVAGDGVQRTFFSRAGWVGSNEVSPVVWAGDQRTSFERDDGLFTVIPMGINLGLAGVNTYGHDIAGYQSNTNPPSTKELFFRWTTLGALSPVMRTHHGIDARANWHFASDADTLAHYRRWAKFHMQLFPFLDGLSANAERTGVPTLRGLLLETPGDAKAWEVSDQFLLGDDFLVAPVVDEGATSRTVYLPAGEWVSWDGVTRAAGPQEIVVDAPLSEIPLFLRKGAVVPRASYELDTVVPAAPPLVDWDDVKLERYVLVVAGGDGRFVERDGTEYVVRAGSAGSFTLPDCGDDAAQRGCVDRSGPRPVARLDGDSLVFPGGTLSITGPQKRYDVEVIE